MIRVPVVKLNGVAKFRACNRKSRGEPSGPNLGWVCRCVLCVPHIGCILRASLQAIHRGPQELVGCVDLIDVACLLEQAGVPSYV